MISILQVSDKQLFTSKEAAGVLGVSVATVDRWRREGKLKASVLAINGKIVFTGAELKKAFITI